MKLLSHRCKVFLDRILQGLISAAGGKVANHLGALLRPWICVQQEVRLGIWGVVEMNLIKMTVSKE